MPSRSLALIVAAAALSGCIYASGNLSRKDGKYTNYPASLEEEHARRAKRRKRALIAAPIEIAAGAALTALALFANGKPPDDGDHSVTDNLGDGLKEIAGRLLIAGIGVGGIMGGTGDLLLGLTDPLFESPLVRDGELVDADRIDEEPPARSPRLNFHNTLGLGTEGTSFDLGFGFAHWPRDRLRLRYAASGDIFSSYSRDRRGGFTLEAMASLAYGREHAGIYARRALSLYGGAGWWWSAERDAPSVAGGVSFDRGLTQYRLGTRYTHGLDRHPWVEFAIRLELRVD